MRARSGRWRARGAVIVLALVTSLTALAPSAAADDGPPTPWGSTSRGPLQPSWAPQKERNARTARSGNKARPLDDTGTDGRRDDAKTIEQLVNLVGMHGEADAGRGIAADEVALALDHIALGTVAEDIQARLRQARVEDRPFRAVLLATLASIYGRAGSYHYELWALCDALSTVQPGSKFAAYLKTRVVNMAGTGADAAHARAYLTAYDQRLRVVASAAATR
jgi:hypothetical protein